MSSPNLVKINYVKEADYGETPSPLSGVTLKTARKIADSLSGTPQTTTSQELRTDRNSAGQVVTGLEVGGGIDFELSPDAFFDDFFEAAMMSAWVADETINTTVDLVPDVGDDQKAELTLGTSFANLVVGTLVKLEPSGADPVIVQVISVDTPSTVFTVATSRGEAALSATMDVTLPQYLDIGTTKSSFAISKAYEDVTHEASSDEHSQLYNGCLVSGFQLNSSYGDIVTGAFNVMGNGYDQSEPSLAQDVVTAGGSVTAAGTALGLNASIDVPLVTTAGEATDFCIEEFTISLDNGLTPQNCIGKQAPTDYSLGTAQISISASIYLTDTSYDAFMPAKLSLSPVSMTFVMHRADGGYAVQLPAVQLSFPDPASEAGDNVQTMIDAQGVAKVGSGAITSAMRIYKL